MGHAGRQAIHIFEVCRDLTQSQDLGLFLCHSLGPIRPTTLKQPLSALSHQLKRCRDCDVGQHVRGIFETQPVVHQPVLTGLAHHLVKESPMAVASQAGAKLRQQARHRQATIQRQAQKKPEGHIDLRFSHHFSIREGVVKLQKFQLDHPHRVFGTATHRRTVAVLNHVSKSLKIHHLLDPAQIVIRRHQLLENQLVHLGRFRIIVVFQHARPPCFVDGCMLYPNTPLSQLSKQPRNGGGASQCPFFSKTVRSQRMLILSALFSMRHPE